MSTLLFVGGPANGDRLAVDWRPYHGRTFEVMEAPRVRLTETIPATPETLAVKRHLYRCVLLKTDRMERFVAVPDHQPDGYALAKLIEGYNP